MTKKLDISLHINHELWKTRLKPYKKTLQIVLEVACAETKLKNQSGIFEIAVVLADDVLVQDLNNKYRGKNQPTNVLSFPSSAFPTELGDIILALETVEKEAREQHKTFRNHTIHLLVHGFLHLLGYDHIEEKDAKKMESKEIKILKKLGIPNPY
jgi:probable rRNA maturation factor